MKWKEATARFRATLGHGWRVVTDGEPLGWPHRMWLAAIFIVGVLYCFAFPPFQTNDEDAHWKHLWGVAYGNLRCNGAKPRAPIDFLGVVHQRTVRENPGEWRVQFARDALRFVGSPEPTTDDGTACRYPPHPYLVPGLVARVVAFGVHGRLGPGSILRAAYAARITNWILVTLAIAAVCRRLPWLRNFALAFYSIPEVIQQSMAVNTDSFLLVAAAALLLLVFGRRVSTWTMVAIGVVVALMTSIKPVYATFGALAFITLWRLFARRRWQYRYLAGIAAALLLPLVAQVLWLRWLAAVAAQAPPVFDRGHLWAQQQFDFLHAHPRIVWTLLAHQWRDFFGADLMKGSWLSIFGAFGWSMFAMERAGYYALLAGIACALGADAVAATTTRELEPPSRGMLAALGVATLAIWISVLATIIGMYIYFSGAFLGRIGADEIIGVQGRYYLIPILFWIAFALYLARRRDPLPRRWLGLPNALTVAALLLCALANVYALREILFHFNAVYLPFPIPVPHHY